MSCGVTPWNSSLPFLQDVSGQLRNSLKVDLDFS